MEGVAVLVEFSLMVHARGQKFDLGTIIEW